MAVDLTKTDSFELGAIRQLFPALSVSGPTGKPWVYLDGPGGTQVPASVAESISQAILFANANRGASFATRVRFPDK